MCSDISKSVERLLRMKRSTTKYGAMTILAAFALVLGVVTVALAQASPTTPSNYATDVQAGQNAVKNDPVVAAAAKEVKDSEKSEGDVDNEPAEVKETVEPQEATETKEVSETKDGADKKGTTNDASPSGNTGVRQ